MLLPESIKHFVDKKKFIADEIGMSGAGVFLFEDMVLKVQQQSQEAENEYCMLRYLQGKLPAPKLYCHEQADGKSYLLMSRCQGEMACAEKYLRNPVLLCRLLADGLQKLWRVDIADCPCDQRLSNKLTLAREQVDKGLVDLENTEPETFGEHGFADPGALLAWLEQNRPREEPVLSHGDYCLPNLFGVGEQVCGYIDLGRAGIGDKWCDIALCYRSLRDNLAGKYGGQAYDNFDPALLFAYLELEPDWEKIRYYILLDELF